MEGEIVAREWEVWDEPGVAERVDEFWHSDGEVIHRKAIADLVVRSGETQVLEVGCGTGLVFGVLWDHIDALDYTGVDNSRRMLEIAKARYPSAKFVYGDAFKLPYKDNRFALATAFEVFGHMPEPEGAIKELVRVGRRAIFSSWVRSGDGGTICVGEHYAHNEQQLIAWAGSTGEIVQVLDWGPIHVYLVGGGF